jgi:hypothetical protein
MNQQARLLDPEDAGIVVLSDRAGKVADRAFKLAGKRREDEAAVAELVALAGGSKRTLENAERFTRQSARHCEDREFNRAHRLLVAAVHRRAVEPPSAEDERIFGIVKTFRALPPAKAWARLVEAESRLGELESETRTGAFPTAVPEFGTRRDEVLRQIAHEQALAGSELGDRLRALVGPLASTTEPLIKSRAALAVAMSHLADVDDAASHPE